jgi:hypothetical protein
MRWHPFALGFVLFCAGTFTVLAGAETTVTPPPPPPLPAPPAQQTIKGDILNIEGEHLVIKDMSGHEIRLRVDKDTKMERVKVGDKIIAMVAADGHAESIQVQLPQ